MSCVIYTIIKNDVGIDYLAFQLKNICEIPVGYIGGSKHEDKIFDKYWVL